jgi:hypothetical protein
MVPLCFGLLVLPRGAGAYNILALDMGGYWNNLADQYIDAHPGMGAPGDPSARWFQMVDYGDLSSTNLMDYDVFLVQSGFLDDYVQVPATGALDALEAKKGDIEDFVRAGHGLVAWSEPFPDGGTWGWPWSPVGLASTGIYHEDLVEVVDPNHPVMDHSTDQSLSEWQSSWHGYFQSWDPRLSVLAQSGDYGSGDPRTHQALTLAGAYNPEGDGRMVFSLQDPAYHAYQGIPGARALIKDALDWAAVSRPIPEPASAWLMACGLLAGGAACLARRRG